MNKKLISIRNKKKKLKEKLDDLNAKYKEICDEEIQVENEEIIVTLRRNNISLEELMEKINDRKREEKLREKEIFNNEETKYD
ncbi:hypothetical protein KQI68_05415 [Peptoniphilus sp. MSJ-1]|uniref:Conjugal transfer protein n=1 Tax=Peptoniphilus ovalis TaxID=2841503 RepID=A0ABS6FGK1_9FIRM|nr:hypothetical protein [Peptoniphilus ovalis]